MLKTTINGVSTVLDIVHFDSGEEPEHACVNTVVVARVGDITFWYTMTPEKSIEALKGEIAERSSANTHGAQALRIPQVIPVRIVRYHQRCVINWDDPRSLYSRSVEMSWSEDPARAALGRAMLEQIGMPSS